MKRLFSGLLAAVLLAGCLSGCGEAASSGVPSPLGGAASSVPMNNDLNHLTSAAALPAPDLTGAVPVDLSDEGITVDGAPIAGDETAAVYAANDIVYYEAGRGFTYGEGTASDEHTADEAAAHTVVHITRPGVYRFSGSLSAGQIAVDLGKNAEKDPSAVVTLVLDGVDLTCTVAPAVIFYNVYECGSTSAATASRTVDTAAAGANVVIADGSVNNISGSYVARIYTPGTVELNDAGTAVEDAKKLHKYDGAFYSRMSMNLFGGAQNTGVLNITAENEGLDSELHLTIHGGVINIASGNDGINTNADEVSVTTINGGAVNITVNGRTGEGDGVDSNGWLVINGGRVTASACARSADAGIDAELGIWINGGAVAAAGHMLDRIAGGTANYAVFRFASVQPGGQTYALKNAAGQTVASAAPENDFSVLILSAPALAEGEYTLWRGQTQLAGSAGAMGGFDGGMRPDEFEWDEPDWLDDPDWDEMERPEGGFGGRGPGGMAMGNGETSAVFVIRTGGNLFGGVTGAT